MNMSIENSELSADCLDKVSGGNVLLDAILYYAVDKASEGLGSGGFIGQMVDRAKGTGKV